jgi:O-antigen/teichoic acid export membrane protein
LAYRGRFDRAKAVQYAHYGFPIALSLILTLVLYTSDRFLIAHYLGAADAGAYGAGYSLASRFLDVLFIWFGAAGEPALINALEAGGVAAMRTTARQIVRTMAFVLFPAVAGLIAVAPALGAIMIGGALRDRAIMVTPMITLGAMFAGFNSYYFLKAFPLARRTGWLVAAMAIPAVLNIALNIVLIPMMGLKGSALATLLSFAIGTVSAIFLCQKGHALPVPLRDLALTGGASAVMMLIVRALPNWHETLAGAMVELGLKAVCGVLIYAVLAWMLNLGGVREWDVKDFLKRRKPVA